jgi:DNA-binding transcriptional ArsR family regulator
MSDGDDVGRVFAALSDATRREVVRRLSDAGDGRTLAEIAATLPVTRQAVAKHLSVLEDAGLVDASTHGRQRRYRLTPAPFAGAMAWMADVGAEWDERLDALRRHLGTG